MGARIGHRVAGRRRAEGGVVIRNCEKKDGEALFKLYAQWDLSRAFDKRVFLDSLEGILKDPSIRLVMAEEDGAIVGYAQISESRKLGHGAFLAVDQLLVDEARRSGGVGKALMEEIERWAGERGLGKVVLHSQAHRSRAHVFYERLGYELKKISKYYEKEIAQDRR